MTTVDRLQAAVGTIIGGDRLGDEDANTGTWSRLLASLDAF